MEATGWALVPDRAMALELTTRNDATQGGPEPQLIRLADRLVDLQH
jgi:hypothetical protein